MVHIIEGGNVTWGPKEEFEAFQDRVKDTFIFPGSLYELNENPQMIGGAQHGYKLLPLKGRQPYVTGVIMPSLEELYQAAAVRRGRLSDFGPRIGAVFDDNTSAEFDTPFGLIEPLVNGLFSNRALIDQDIRVKAKELGASGIVRVQLYSAEDTTSYWGLPVVEKNPGRR